MEKIKIISFGKSIGKIKKVFGRKKTNKNIGTKFLQKKIILEKLYKQIQIKILEKKNLQK